MVGEGGCVREERDEGGYREEVEGVGPYCFRIG